MRYRASALRPRIVAVAALLVLSACGGTDYSGAADDTGGSTGATTGSGTTGTTTGASTGSTTGSTTGGTPPPEDSGGSGGYDLVKGAQEYENQCKSCHGSKGGGGVGPALTGTGTCPSCSGQAALEARIADTMPSTNPGNCAGACAANVAAYVLNGFSTAAGGSTGSSTGSTTGTSTGTSTGSTTGTGTGTTTGSTTGGSTGSSCTPPEPEPEPEPPAAATCTVQAGYSSSWNNGFVYNVTIRNNSGANVSGWKVTWTFPNDQTVSNFWNTKLAHSGQNYEALPESYNGSIANGGSVEFGMQGAHGGVNDTPVNVRAEAPGCVFETGPGSTTGSSTGSTTGGDGCTEEPPPTGGGGEACDAQPPPAPRLQRLLTRREYERTVQDLVGITGDFAVNIPLEARVMGYDNNARVAQVTDRHMDEYLAAAETVAARAVAERKSALLGCDPTADKAGCTRSFVQQFGRRAFRRPLSSAETDQYAALMNDSLTGGSFDKGMELIINALLLSPYYLYRSESGALVDGVYRLDGYELASSLSYLLWGSMPDEQLLTAAGDGTLASADGREAQARRLMADARAREQMGNFASQWLGTDYLLGSFKDPEIFPRLTDEVRRSMVEELSRFVNHVVFDSATHRFDELLTADYSFVNGPLRNYYGMAGDQAATDFARQDSADGTRGGVLALGAVLASHAHSNESSPIKRGVFVRERMLCHELPEPPADVDTTPPGLDPTKTTRERFAAHTADPTCSSCHSFIDGIGFGLERYDGAGGYRMSENGATVDDSGEVKGPESLSDPSVVPFHGVKELQALMAQTAAARDCMVLQYYRYGRGYVEESYDECTVDSLETRFASNQGDLQSLLIDYIRDDGFALRRAQ